MNNSLSDAVNTTLTTAANEAVDDALPEIFAAIIEKAVKEQAKKLERAFAAAVNDAVHNRVKKLEAMHKRTIETNKKATEVKIAKAVSIARLEGMIAELEWATVLEWEIYGILEESGDTYAKNGFPRQDEYHKGLLRRMDNWKEELEFEEEQEEKV